MGFVRFLAAVLLTLSIPVAVVAVAIVAWALVSGGPLDVSKVLLWTGTSVLVTLVCGSIVLSAGDDPS